MKYFKQFFKNEIRGKTLSMIIVFTLLVINNISAQNCFTSSMQNDYWIVNYCPNEGVLFDGISIEKNSIFSFAKLKVDDDVFFNISLILPDKNKDPYYVIQLYFIDDASDNISSLFKGIPFVKLKCSANKDFPFTNYLSAEYAYKKAIKYNEIPLRAAVYNFELPLYSFQSMVNYYKSSDFHQIVFELKYGNKPDIKKYREFAFTGKEIDNLLTRISLVKYEHK